MSDATQTDLIERSSKTSQTQKLSAGKDLNEERETNKSMHVTSNLAVEELDSNDPYKNQQEVCSSPIVDNP